MFLTDRMREETHDIRTVIIAEGVCLSYQQREAKFSLSYLRLAGFACSPDFNRLNCPCYTRILITSYDGQELSMTIHTFTLLKKMFVYINFFFLRKLKSGKFSRYAYIPDVLLFGINATTSW